MVTYSRISQIIYTSCPVVCASTLAFTKGWLSEEFSRDGVVISSINTLMPADRFSHFSHEHPQLIRDGGNIPAIWARSEGVGTKVIGMTWAEGGQAILVRKGSLIESVAELKGSRIILPRRLRNVIDFRLGRAKRGFIMALAAHGLTLDDVEVVDLPIDAPDIAGIGIDPSTGWRCEQQPEIEALQSRLGDAIFSYRGVEVDMERMGVAKILYSLNRHPNWRYRITNDNPVVCTVNASFAREYPDVITRWMKTLVRAGVWAKSHHEEVMQIMPNAVQVSKEAFLKSYPVNFSERLVPNISNLGIEALEIQKLFLLEHGLITNDFDVKAWVDDSFLKQALEQVKAELSQCNHTEPPPL